LPHYVTRAVPGASGQERDQVRAHSFWPCPVTCCDQSEPTLEERMETKIFGPSCQFDPKLTGTYRRHFDVLANCLNGELVERIILGMEGIRPTCIAATATKVILVSQNLMGFFNPMAQAIFSYDRISSIAMESALFLGVRINVMSQIVTLKMVSPHPQDFVNFVMGKINRTIPPTNPMPAVDVPNQLKQFAELKSQGVITEEEFLAQKKKLLCL
jgi:hypothetical protein